METNNQECPAFLERIGRATTKYKTLRFIYEDYTNSEGVFDVTNVMNTSMLSVSTKQAKIKRFVFNTLFTIWLLMDARTNATSAYM